MNVIQTILIFQSYYNPHFDINIIQQLKTLFQ